MNKKNTVKSKKAVGSVKKKQKLNFAEDFDSQWDDHEPDTIFGIYGSPDHSLGVVKTLYSGLPTLERALAIKRDTGIYGTPMNKIIEVFGSESSGKSSWCLYTAIATIKSGGVAYYVDFEHKFDPAWLLIIAEANGVSKELIEKRFKYVDPKHMEGFMGWLLKRMKSIINVKTEARNAITSINKAKKKVDGWEDEIKKMQKIVDTPFFICVDSVACMYTKAEMKSKKAATKEGDEESDEINRQIAEVARIFDLTLKHVRRYLGFTNCLIVFVNQIRDKIETNQWLARKMGSRIKSPGGNAIKHLCDARIQISRVSSIKRTRNKIPTVIGTIYNFRTVKNQMGIPPFQEIKMKFLNDRGFFSFHSVLEAMVGVGKIKKRGSVYVFNIKGKRAEIHESDLDEELIENPEYEKLMHNAYRKHMEGQ